MTERIGLEAVLEMGQFNSGLSDYTGGLNVMGSLTSSVSSVIGNLFDKALQAAQAFGAGVVSEGMAYTSAMSNVAALSGAVGTQFDQLSAQAEQLGATTKFTATEAAEGMGFLAMAGFEVNEIIGTMPGVLNLASAANIDLGKSADIVSNILTGMGLDVSQTDALVDTLAATMTSANVNMTQLGSAFKYVGPVAASFGLDVNDVSAAIGRLGDAGIQGTAAGTALRASLLGLAAPTKAATAVMSDLGIITADGRNQLFDLQGNMLPLPQVIGKVQQAIAGLSQEQQAQALKTIVGTRNIGAFQILLEQGQSGLQAYGDELRGSLGRASEIAAQQMDNLSGDVTLFQSALSGIQISIFKELEPILRAVTQAGTQLLAVVGPPLQSAFASIAPIISNAINAITNLISGFQSTANQAGSWGYNIASYFASGISSGIGLIVNVMNSISNMLANWLSPGSPPKVAPDIDKWGAATMGEWLNGFSNADFSAFDKISNEIEKALQASVDAGDMDQSALIPALLGSRDAVAAALTELNQTGTISEETFQSVVDAAGPAGDAVKGLLNSYLGLAQASQGVEQAQGNLDKSLADVDAAYNQLANASSKAEEEAALKAIEVAEANRLQARTELESAQASEKAAKEKAANEEKIRRIQEENAKLLKEQEELLAKNNEEASNSDAVKEAERRAKAERDYRFGIADTAGKMAILQDELKNAEEGSVEYYDILGQLHRLEQQRLDEEARANEDLADSAGGGGGGASLGGGGGGPGISAPTAPELPDLGSLAEQAGVSDILLGGDGLSLPFEDAEGSISDVFDNITEQAEGFQDTIFDIAGAMSQTRDNIVSSVSPIITAFTNMKDTVVGFATEIFDAYSRGGVPAVLETLGITPQALELATKIKDTFWEIVGVIGSIAGAAASAAVSFDWLGTLNSTIIFVNENFEAIKGALIGIGVALAAIGIVALIASIVAAFNPLTLIIGGVILVAGLLGAAWATNFGGIRNITTQVFGVINAVIGQFVTVFTETVWPAIQQALTNLTEALSSMGISWSDIWTALGTAVGIVAGVIGVAILGMIGFGLALVAGIASAVAAATAYWEQFSQGSLQIFEGIGTFLTGWWNIIVGLFTLNFEQISTGFDMLGQGLIGIVTGLWDMITAVFQGGFDGVIAGITTFSDTIIGFFDAMYMAIVGGSIVPDLINGIIEWFSMLGGPVLEIVQGLIGSVTDLFNTVVDFFGGSGEQLNVDTQAMLEAFTVTLPEAITAFTELVNQAFGIMSQATLAYGTFLTETLVGVALPNATQAHARLGSDVARVWSALISIANQYMGVIVTITTTSIPAMAAAFVSAGTSIKTTTQGIITAIGTIKTKLDQDTPGIKTKFGEIITKIGEIGPAITGSSGPIVAIGKIAPAITGGGGPIEAVGKLQAKIDSLSTSKVDSVKNSFDSLKSKVSDVIGKVQELIDKINSIPDIPESSSSNSSNLNASNLTVPGSSLPNSLTTSNSVVNNTPNVIINVTVDNPQRMQQLVTLIDRTVSGNLS